MAGYYRGLEEEVSLMAADKCASKVDNMSNLEA